MCKIFKSVIDSLFNIKMRFNKAQNTSAPVLNGDNIVSTYNCTSKEEVCKSVKFNVIAEYKGKGKYVITIENKGNLDARNVKVRSCDRHITFHIEDDFVYDRLLNGCSFSFNATTYIGCPNSLRLEVSWDDEISVNNTYEIQYVVS